MTRRWPLGALLVAAGVTRKGLTHRAGLSSSSVYWADDRGLTDKQADEWALRCDLMPHEVWGDAWFDAALSPLDRQYLAGGWRQAWLWNEDRPELEEAA